MVGILGSLVPKVLLGIKKMRKNFLKGIVKDLLFKVFQRFISHRRAGIFSFMI